MPFKNRRKHQGIKVNFTACVRNSGFEDRLVQCENVSRGGLCFKSSQRYYEAARVEVAAPYSQGSPGILVPTQIVHVRELPECSGAVSDILICRRVLLLRNAPNPKSNDRPFP